MLTAGDEFGRSQHGNNNAYAQDNPLTWIDWTARDIDLEDHVADLAQWRASHHGARACFPEDGRWLTMDGTPMTTADWDAPGASIIVWRAADGTGFAVDRKGPGVPAQAGGYHPSVAIPELAAGPSATIRSPGTAEGTSCRRRARPKGQSPRPECAFTCPTAPASANRAPHRRARRRACPTVI
jgi:hypothetical protein